MKKDGCMCHRERVMTIPLIQGGMGVGVSLEKLAGAVAREGGMGCISTADCGYREPDFMSHPEEANLRALQEEIRKAREISGGKGLIAINAMVATRQYDDAVRTAIAVGVDAVISGAGLPMNLPELVPEGKALMIPIVSSGRAARLICKVWMQRYHRTADAFVIEGYKAGGHLGFSEKQLLAGECQELPEILREVKRELLPYEKEKEAPIPVFCAGGIWDRKDVTEIMEAGADGVQMATRFIGTEECDASDAYKEILLSAKSEDLEIIHSPVGMPGRAVHSKLLQKLSAGRVAPTHCSHCIKSCNPATVPYCITNALIEAVKGNAGDGLFFSGSNVGRLTEMSTVHEVIASLRLQ